MKKKFYSIFIFVLIFVSVFTFQTKKGPHVEAFGLPGPFGGLVSVVIPCPNTSSVLRTVVGPKGGLNMWMPTTFNYANFVGYTPSTCVLGQSAGVMVCCAAFTCYGAGYISLFEGSSFPGCTLGAGASAAAAGASSAFTGAAVVAGVAVIGSMNQDSDNDGQCDLNCDTNGDGQCNLNCDTNGDGQANEGVDNDGDGECDSNCEIFDRFIDDVRRPLGPAGDNLPDAPNPF